MSNPVEPSAAAWPAWQRVLFRFFCIYLTLQIAISQEPTPLAVEVSVVRWCKDGHFGVEFLRYSQGDRERVTNLLEALPPTETPARPDYATMTLSAFGS